VIKKYSTQQGFCVRRAELQNSTAVFQLNFSKNIGFCASISRPNAKPRNVSGNVMNKLLLLTFFNLISVLAFSQQKTNYEIIETIPKVSAYAFLPDIYIMEDSLSIDYNSGNIKTFGAEHNSQIFETNEKYLDFIKKRDLIGGINYERYEIENEIKDFVTITFLIASDGSLNYPRLLKPAEYKSINEEIIRVFKRLPKIIPPTDKTKKKLWTLVSCRIYLDISPIKLKSKKSTYQIQQIKSEQLQTQPIRDTTISCELGKK